MKSNIFKSIKLTIVLLVLCCGIYPLLVSLISMASPGEGGGEKLSVNGVVVGYKNIGQTFNQDKYFWSRPSAVNYSASGSAGSNKGPSNAEYLNTVQARIDSFLVHNPTIQKMDIPVDMVTASGSGLDPHISVKGAMIQINRIAKERNLDKTLLENLVKSHINNPVLGIFGIPNINVLELNIALDALSK